MSAVLRSFEFESVAGQLQSGHLPNRDPEQPREGIRSDSNVPTSRYRNAECPSRIPERVAL